MKEGQEGRAGGMGLGLPLPAVRPRRSAPGPCPVEEDVLPKPESPPAHPGHAATLQAKQWIEHYLEGLVDRAIRVPLRSHTPASRASLYLLGSLASTCVDKLSHLGVCAAVLR